jgi:hypothetical protein
MNEVSKVSTEGQFAWGQDSRDLQVVSDDADVENQSWMRSIRPMPSLAFSRIRCEGRQSFNGGHLKMETSMQEQGGRRN